MFEARVPVNPDGRFEALVAAPLPAARRGWRVARNRVQWNGQSAEACNVVLLPPEEAAAAAVVVLPLDITWPSGGAMELGSSAEAGRLAPRWQEVRREVPGSLPVYYLAVVPPGDQHRRAALALAAAAVGWPAGHFLLLNTDRSDAPDAVAAALDRLRWVFHGSLDLWLITLDSALASAVAASREPCADRAVLRPVCETGNGHAAPSARPRRVSARPTRAALLPRHPVVFCHGMLAFSMLKMYRPDDVNYFSVLREFLDPRGVHVLFPRVAPTGGVEYRARQLREQILAWTDEPVNIVAHSMGGLDARYLISRLGFADRVQSLTTIGTPHRGSHMADWFQANFRRGVPLLFLLEALGLDVDGFGACRPSACREFNASTPDAAGVRYFSFGGDVPAARVTPFLRRAWNILSPVEGPNDGLVSVASAHWGEYLGSVRADHFAQTPDAVFVRDGEDFDALGFYLRLVEDLARRGF
jgi:triacylglycerol lipase